ncbi:Uncharacterised protein [Burkholderia pseudomallei]|uniref:hypothetical protein n=1 Tax=Burkholderia pseudomallei TaxID=28450 RepID=UPI000F06AED5|nr:hypothetical protein [Burkholderia pseudomallei]CAJ4148820.1 Uncharacterised protein [Burkholderia pseudomallei]CAJ4630003.1 Uncharacterised protein [Burkholderia pseudomallei]CAJ4794769.1 Uncharacterised protein [Burkholderia pseudomallei]CAJ5322672.1 Uncharacterised protein [Burkholderia pseudomallei]CAJ5996639.1 Uncharacterised protein [Burkholderia pseudomallei]
MEVPNYELEILANRVLIQTTIAALEVAHPGSEATIKRLIEKFTQVDGLDPLSAKIAEIALRVVSNEPEKPALTLVKSD